MAKTIKASESTAVAVAGQFNESNIQPMLEQINARISQLTGGKDKKSSFSGQIMGIKLSEVKDVAVLMDMYAYITKKSEAIESVKDVFLAMAPTTKIKDFREEGCSAKDLQESILDRYAEVTHESELATLKETKQALEECLSEEAKKAAKLQNLGEKLANLLAK